ncbi:hypothetical protein EYC84_002708 [Monilinia fructicola]|uniref:Uncharacterized protein n=1 Tax=Monilinia fructicola TaxID=38448 RepID=A0A5M9JRK8_MONFR|nr:hypothetical protein EYC84_002708 [Monilinia fructicola]
MADDAVGYCSVAHFKDAGEGEDEGISKIAQDGGGRRSISFLALPCPHAWSVRRVLSWLAGGKYREGSVERWRFEWYLRMHPSRMIWLFASMRGDRLILAGFYESSTKVGRSDPPECNITFQTRRERGISMKTKLYKLFKDDATSCQPRSSFPLSKQSWYQNDQKI